MKSCRYLNVGLVFGFLIFSFAWPVIFLILIVAFIVFRISLIQREHESLLAGSFAFGDVFLKIVFGLSIKIRNARVRFVVLGEVSSANDQKPSGKLTRGRYTYQSPDDAKNGIAKVTTVTTAVGKDTGPEITEVTEEFNGSEDRIDGNKIVKRSRTNDKFESIQKRFSQESFDRNGRRSSKETNGYEKPEESPRSTPRSSLVRGDSIKALQHKFQQATGNLDDNAIINNIAPLYYHALVGFHLIVLWVSVSSSLKQNRPVKCDSSGSITSRTEEKTVTTKLSDTSRHGGGATSFLDNNSRVTGVQDVLTRMRNADLGESQRLV